MTRKTLPGGDKEPFDSGYSAFRFMIERDIFLTDPITEPLFKNLGRMAVWQGEDRRIVMYPCNDDRLINFVAIHPSVETGSLGAGKSYPSIARKHMFGAIHSDIIQIGIKAGAKTFCLLCLSHLVRKSSDFSHMPIPRESEYGSCLTWNACRPWSTTTLQYLAMPHTPFCHVSQSIERYNDSV
jgi:hypothetical protein